MESIFCELPKAYYDDKTALYFSHNSPQNY